MSAPAPSRLLSCADDARRATLLGQSARHGIDYLEVTTPDQLTLEVHLIADPGVVAFVSSLDGRTDKVRISGGERVRDIAITGVSVLAPGSDTIVVKVDRTGDFSTYTLAIEDATMDLAYAEVDFTFKAGCPARFDCAPRSDCPEPVLEEPPIDYMAKDYASFRRPCSTSCRPGCRGCDEEHAADLSVSLVELLAYVGDLLSCEQDAVATEAYLATARRRTSVRRHARLVDYRMHDGTSARTWVYARLATGAGTGLVRAGTQVLTRLTMPVGQAPPPHPAVLVPARPADAEAARAGATAVFEIVEDANLAEKLNELPVHTWGDGNCCLPTGSTAAHLQGDVAFVPGDAARSDSWRLRPGARLLLEEIASPVTGLAADADPAHRQVVTLTRVERARDELLGVALTYVNWAQDDALRFPLCLSVVDEPGTAPRRVAAARGNLMLADHGVSQPLEWHPENPGWTGPPLAALPGPGIEVGERAFELTLGEGPLARRVPLRRGARRRVRSRPFPTRARRFPRCASGSVSRRERWRTGSRRPTASSTWTASRPGSWWRRTTKLAPRCASATTSTARRRPTAPTSRPATGSESAAPATSALVPSRTCSRGRRRSRRSTSCATRCPPPAASTRSPPNASSGSRRTPSAPFVSAP